MEKKPKTFSYIFYKSVRKFSIGFLTVYSTLKAFNNNDMRVIYQEAIKLYGNKEDVVKLFELYDDFFLELENYNGDSTNIDQKWRKFESLLNNYLNSKNLHNADYIKEQVMMCYYRLFNSSSEYHISPYFNKIARTTYRMLETVNNYKVK